MDDTWSYAIVQEDLESPGPGSAPWRQPAYPLLMSLVDLEGLPDRLPLILLQQGMDLAVALIVAGLASGISRGLAGPAALAYLLHPVPVLHSMLVLPDTLMTLCLVCGAVLWMKSTSAGPRRAVLLAALSGLALSAGASVKPVLLPAPVVPAVLSILPGTGGTAGTRVLRLSAMLAAFAVLPLLVAERNARLYGLEDLSAQGSYEFLGRVAILSGATTMEDFPAFLDSVGAPVRGEAEPWRARDSLYRAAAFRCILRNPAGVIGPHLWSWPGFFKPGTSYLDDFPPLADRPEALGAVKAAAGSFSVAFGVLVLAYLLGGASRSVDRGLYANALAWAVYSALLAGPLAGNPRYGLTFLWAVAPGAALTASKAAGRLRRAVRGRLRPRSTR